MDSNVYFEKQFAQKEYLQTPFGKIETIDITPKKLSTKIPMLLASGWGETLELQKVCLKEIYATGRRVIALRHAVVIKKSAKKTAYPTAELQKAETILLLLQHKHINTVDVVSHSEGSINIAIAAAMCPNLFRKLVLVTPAGMSGKDSQVRIILGFARHLLATKMQSPEQLLLMIKSLKKPEHQEKVPILQQLLSFKKEITAMALYDIHPLLINLRKQGIKIAVLAGEMDTAFPLARMKKHLEKGILEYNFRTEQEKRHYGLDIFATKKGGHELYTNTPEVMRQVFQLFEQLV